MVRAILDGRKTMTRRVVKPQPPKSVEKPQFDNRQEFNSWCFFGRRFGIQGRYSDYHAKCPYGKFGDKLWVREKWATVYALDTTRASALRAGFPCEFSAGGTDVHGFDHLGDRGRWRPSIFMPRSASRITLEITAVRVERLQQITESDAKAEGVMLLTGSKSRPLGSKEKSQPVTHHQTFHGLWDSLNEKRGYGWDGNPWVWVISFRRVE
jgi:hypothetical protein